MRSAHSTRMVPRPVVAQAGVPRFCHNTEVASARLALFERRVGGFEEIALLESNGTTHAEWAGLTPAAAVVREHVDLEGMPA